MKNFTQIPNWLLLRTWTSREVKLTNADFRLLLFIKAMSTKKGYCYATRETMGRMLGWNKRTVIRSIVSLESAGWIAIERTKHQTSLIKIVSMDDEQNTEKVREFFRILKREKQSIRQKEQVTELSCGR